MPNTQAKTMPKSEAGFMGLEGMGNVLFYLIMLAGVALLIVQLFSENKLAKVEQCLTTMRMGIQQLYAAKGNYGTDDWQTMSQIVSAAGILPEGFEYKTFTSGFGSTQIGIKTPWDTSIRVSPLDNGKKFAIKIYVPEDKCLKLATYGLDSWDAMEIGFGNKTKPIYSIQDVPKWCKDNENTLLVFISK